MPNSMVAERPEVSSLRQTTEFRSRTRTPYGLPIEDDCSACKVRSTQFFCGFSERSRAALRPIMHVSTYPEGALIVMEGEAARGVHLLCQGRVKLLTTNSDGKTFILKIANAGEVIGLNPILTGMPYDITVETLQPCQLAFIPREEFLRFMREHNDASFQVAQHLGRDCQMAYEVIRSIGLSNSAAEKLARFLVEWAGDGRPNGGTVRLKLTLTHEEMAQLIGCSRETVSRTLGEFKRQHLVEVNGSTLVLRDIAALEDLAAN
jgi:CRP/FNR family transcriptional regulator, cyclic AMP receptor protein